MDLDKVQVLLSTYNGEKYVREQLDSILEQQVEVDLLIRDDGSRDATPEILREYEKTYANIHVIYGENIGVIQSFFALMNAADRKCSYIALADQDDVWLPEKLSRAVTLLKEQERKEAKGSSVPVAYCSARQLVDAELNELPSGISYDMVYPVFENALVENMCTGCTCVMNSALLQLLQGKIPQFTVMHDFWIYLVVTCFGTVIYDEESYILYRQHGQNQLGSASTLFGNYVRRIKNFKKQRWQLSRQAEALLLCYGDSMPVKYRALAQLFVAAKKDRKARKTLLAKRTVFRQRKSDYQIMKILLRLGLL